MEKIERNERFLKMIVEEKERLIEQLGANYICAKCTYGRALKIAKKGVTNDSKGTI